jgi:hypothetical protein
VALPTCLLAAYFFRDDAIVKYLLLAAALGTLLAALAGFFILSFRDPDRLQSEEFVLRQRELIIYEKGANAEIVDPSRDAARIERHPGGFVDGGNP